MDKKNPESNSFLSIILEEIPKIRLKDKIIDIYVNLSPDSFNEILRQNIFSYGFGGGKKTKGNKSKKKNAIPIVNNKKKLVSKRARNPLSKTMVKKSMANLGRMSSRSRE